MSPETESSTNQHATLSRVGNVALIQMDDGRANAIGHAMLDDLNVALSEAEEADAVVMLGREGKFSAGFDLSVMQGEVSDMIELVTRGAELAIDMLGYKRPLVLGVTGHALAMGAVMLCCADHRVGAQGDFKIGYNELAIGMPMPGFATEISRTRLTPAGLHTSIALARIHTPTEAAEIGFLDEVVAPEQVKDTAVAVAAEVGEYLDLSAFEATRPTMRGEVIERLRAMVSRGQ